MTTDAITIEKPYETRMTKGDMLKGLVFLRLEIERLHKVKDSILVAAQNSQTKYHTIENQRSDQYAEMASQLSEMENRLDKKSKELADFLKS